MATPREIIENLRRRIEARPEEAAKIDASYRFDLHGEGGGQWTFSLRPPVLLVEAADPADCVISLSAKDFVDLFEGRANAQQLFFTGSLQIQGDLQQALKLRELTQLLR
jgi:predicted lipid carrier protein YhbT